MPGGRSPHHSLGRRALGHPARCGVTEALAEGNTISFRRCARSKRFVFSIFIFMAFGYLLG